MAKRGSVIWGLILIAVGAYFLAAQLFPGVAEWLDPGEQWPWVLVIVGGLFIGGAFLGNAELAIPGAFFVGLGLIFIYQNATGDWDSWAYVWTLFPGFVGVGTFLRHLLRGQPGRAMRKGGSLIGISLVLFVIFGAFLGGWGVEGDLLWPVGLILLGVWLLVRNVLRGSQRARKKVE